MVFYDCKELVCTQLGEYVEALLRQKGLEVMPLVTEYNTLSAMARDEYSRAVLMKGVYLETPPFSNTPNRNFKRLFRDNLIQTFEVLGWATTQQQMHRVSEWLRDKQIADVLNAHQQEQLENLFFIKDAVTKHSNWHVAARRVLNGMNANTAELAAITDEEKEFSNSLRFDWYYNYCDDMSGYRAGKARHCEVVTRTLETLAVKPYLKKVVQVVAASNGFGENFFTSLPR